MPIPLLNRRWLFFTACAVLFLVTTISFRSHIQTELQEHIPSFKKPPPPPPPPAGRPRYKPLRNDTSPPIVDNFPLAGKSISPEDLPAIPSWNRPPSPHVPEYTPIFIGFTRNWLLLQQVVVSYITAGWPPEDIYVVENTGTMNANAKGKLSLQNPFFLDHHRLKNLLGVNVVSTPTLMSFAQLQNFYMWYAMGKGWDYYFWTHMDIVVLGAEDWRDASGNFHSLYMRAVQDLRHTRHPSYAVDPTNGKAGRWAIKFFAYDALALVNRLAFEEVGGWDTQIPYYGTDCDMHERLTMAGFKQEDAQAGLVYDVGTALPDLSVLYRREPLSADDNDGVYDEADQKRKRTVVTVSTPSCGLCAAFNISAEEDDIGSPAYDHLTATLNAMQQLKKEYARGRNFWQAAQRGGQGEPYYRDSEGFEIALQMTIESGRQIMAEKWGHRGCDLRGVGLGKGDEWRVERDWEDPPPRR